MAEEEEKTEEPSKQRLRKAKEEGDVLRSMDVQAFVMLIASALTLIFLFDFETERLSKLYVYYHELIGTSLTVDVVIDIAIKTFQEFLILLLVFAIPLMLAAVFGSFIQFGFNFAPSAIAPKFNKLNPFPGLKKLFSFEKFIDAIIITLKSMLALGVATMFFVASFNDYYDLPAYGLSSQYQWFKENILTLIGELLIVFFFIAVFDYAWKRHNYFKKHKMTKDERKQEYKQQEGSPEIKQRIAQIRREMQKKSMIKAVPTADVVITNPTHFAVALLYDKTKHNAPVVVAKGMDNMALMIKKIAKENDIPIIENKSLAQSMYKMVDEGEEIPQEFVVAVVNIYVELMKLNKLKGNKWQ